MSTKNDRMRLLVVGIAAMIAIGVGNVNADFTFGEPVNMGPLVNSESSEYSHCISADGLELYMGSYRDGGYGSADIWVSKRTTTEDEWGVPENLGPLVNTASWDLSPCLSTDGLELYFHSGSEAGGLGASDIWVSWRAAKGEPWGEVVNLGAPINTELDDYNPCLSGDGLELYFVHGWWDPEDAPTEVSIYVTRRATVDDLWGEPEDLGPVVNSQACQDTPWISSDGRVLMFTDAWICEPRPDGFGGTDIWFTRRLNIESEWCEPVNLGPAINTPHDEDFPMISADGSTLYFSSNRFSINNDFDIYEAPILPVIDFDSDGIVAINDLLMLIESLGTDDPKCDIGPMLWGDGVVDKADVEVLMKYWGQDLNEPPPLPEPIAHWKLDESEGTVAYDSAGTNDAKLVGDPLWKPAGGCLDGALELDGVDDGAQAGFLFDPMDTTFSTFAWIKGGGLDQVVISQAKGESGRGVNWLKADPITGNLMTEFQYMDENYSATNDLISSVQIIDGKWHHVGLVWDSFGTRFLYVDGFEVAKNTVRSGFLFWEDGGINIGFQASIMHRPGYWSGLIDDVRIYDRVLTADEITEIIQQCPEF